MSYLSEHLGAEIDLAVKVWATGKGVASIANGVAGGSVSGLALGFTPTQVLLTMMIPDEGMIIQAVAVYSSLSADGFDYYLTAETDSADYKLAWELKP